MEPASAHGRFPPDVWRLLTGYGADFSGLLRASKALRQLALGSGRLLELAVCVIDGRATSPDAPTRLLLSAARERHAARLRRVLTCQCRPPRDAWRVEDEYGTYDWFFRVHCATLRVARAAARSCTDERVLLAVGLAVSEVHARYLQHGWALPLVRALKAKLPSVDVLLAKMFIKVYRRHDGTFTASALGLDELLGRNARTPVGRALVALFGDRVPHALRWARRVTHGNAAAMKHALAAARAQGLTLEAVASSREGHHVIGPEWLERALAEG